MIRPIDKVDLPALKALIEATQLFPADMLDKMTADYFTMKESREIWLTAGDTQPIAIAYCAPEKMTEGTWNLYLIAVHPAHQKQGHGTAIVQHLETLLREKGERILLVETSGLEEFSHARAFYQKCGYEQEAQIRDFYQAGENKIVFRKAL